MAGRKSDFTLPTLDDLFSTQELRDDAKLSKIRDIPLELIDDFPDHPFKVRDDEDMIQLVESVKERGVITPATVRQKEDGRYELISGHRRKRACELAGFEAVGIAIAATGVCFVQRVGGSRLCGIHHAEVWHRRQQHRKRKQHRQQLFFACSSCFHVSSCFLFHIFYLKEKSARTMSYASFVKGLLGRAMPVHVWLPRLFPAAICYIHFSLSKAMKRQHPFDTALCICLLSTTRRSPCSRFPVPRSY